MTVCGWPASATGCVFGPLLLAIADENASDAAARTNQCRLRMTFILVS
jgi:hypothetical protein